MMQPPYPGAVPLRAIQTAAGMPYVSAQPAMPIKTHKAASVVPGAAGTRIQVAAGGGGRIAHHAQVAPPAAVAAAPTPAGSKAPKVQQQQQASQLQYLPRFRPPSFEGENGVLPTPESPGSTPRNSENGEGEFEIQTTPAADAVVELLGPYAIGSIVEYRSRSSGQWILAKVEGFDEANQTYRLDVQPHANPERVRLRCGGNSAAAVSTAVQASTNNGGAATPCAAVTLGVPGTPAEAMEMHGEVATISMPVQATPPRPAVEVDLVSPYTDAKESQARRSCASVGTVNACQSALESSPIAESADPSVAQLLIEVEKLRSHVSRLQAENGQLREQVSLETNLKDRYYQECRMLQEQQRVRGTPR